MTARDTPEGGSRAQVSVGLNSETLVPDEVTRIIQLEPSKAFAKGDPSPKSGTPRPWGVWARSVSADDVEPAALQLLNTLRGKEDPLRRAAALFSATITVSIWWEPEGGQGGYSMSPETMRKLTEIAQRIDFYFA